MTVLLLTLVRKSIINSQHKVAPVALFSTSLPQTLNELVTCLES